MRSKGRRAAWFVFIVSLCQVCSAAIPWLHVEGNRIKDPQGNVVVLRGVSLREISGVNAEMVMDIVTNTSDKASSSPGWYTRIVRLPLGPTPGNWTQYNQTYIKPAVDYATQKGLYAILDLHYVAETGPNVSNANSCWSTLAPLYKDYPNVIFEPYNEPINQSQSWSQFKPTMQAWVNLIRAQAPKNLIFAGSPIWSQEMGDAATDSLTGGNIVYVVHMYPNHWAVQWNKDQVQKCAAARPMVCTEWGFRAGLNWGPNETVSGYGMGIMTWLESLKISWTAWCADVSWDPIMFNNGNPWTLRVGEGEMGGFVKDRLYTYRDSSQPSEASLVTDGGFSHAAALSLVVKTYGRTLDVTAPKIGEYKVRIVDCNGAMAARRSFIGNSFKMNTAFLAKGLYIIKVTGNDGFSGQRRLWLNR